MNLSNKILYLTIAIAVVLTAVAVLFYYLVVDKEESDNVKELTPEEMQDVLDSLSVPASNVAEEPSQEIIDSLSAPVENNSIDQLSEKELQDILDSLSVPKN